MAIILKEVKQNIKGIQKVQSNIVNSRRGYYIDDKGRTLFSLDVMEDSRGQEMYIVEDLETGRIVSYPVRRGCFAEQERGRYQRVEYVLTKCEPIDTNYVEKDLEGREVFLFDEQVPRYVIKNNKDYILGHNFILINKK